MVGGGGRGLWFRVDECMNIYNFPEPRPTQWYVVMSFSLHISRPLPFLDLYAFVAIAILL